MKDYSKDKLSLTKCKNANSKKRIIPGYTEVIQQMQQDYWEETL